MWECRFLVFQLATDVDIVACESCVTTSWDDIIPLHTNSFFSFSTPNSNKKSHTHHWHFVIAWHLVICEMAPQWTKLQFRSSKQEVERGRGSAPKECFYFYRVWGKPCLNCARMCFGIVLSAIFPQSGPWRTWFRLRHRAKLLHFTYTYTMTKRHCKLSIFSQMCSIKFYYAKVEPSP